MVAIRRRPRRAGPVRGFPGGPILVAAAAVLLAAASAAAQATSGPGVAGDKAGVPPKKGERPIFAPEAPPPPVEPDPPPAVPEPPPPSPEASIAAALAPFPTAAGREAARAVALRYAAEPDVRAAVRGILRLRPVDARLASAAAFVVAEAGDGEAAVEIVALLRDRALWSRPADALDALVRVDASRATERLLSLLDVPSSPFLAALAQALRPRLTPADVPALAEAARRGPPSTRRTALGLAADADPVGSRPVIEAALGDASADVAATAALLLALRDDPEAPAALNALVRAPGDRRAAFAALALARAGERTGASLLEPATVATLLGSRGLRSQEMAVRVLAAVVLADHAYVRADAAVDPLLEREIVPILVETVAGNRFSSDLPVLRPLALARLLRLAEGTGGLRTAPEWGAWWEQNREGFVARRVLADLSGEAAASLRVTVAGRGAGAAGTGVFAASAGGAPPEGGARGRWIVLSPEERARVAAAVVASGILSVPEVHGGGDDAVLAVEVAAGRRRRALRWFRAEAVPAGVQALLETLAAVREANRWQALWDRTVAPTFGGFVEVEGRFWRGDAGADARRARLTQLAVGAARDAGDETLRAEILEALVADPHGEPPLDAAAAGVLASFAAVGDRLGRSGEAALRVLAAARRTEGLPVLHVLLERPGDAARAGVILADTLARAPLDAAVAAASEGSSPAVRCAALAALARRSDGGALAAEAARAALRSRDASVRGAALHALGAARAPDAATLLEGALGVEEDSIALEGAVEGLGALGGSAVVPLIGRALHAGDARVRAAAVRSLAATGEPEGLSLVLSALATEADPAVRAEIEEAIRTTGGDRAREALRSLAMDTRRDVGLRVRAIDGLGVLGADASAADLRVLLADASGAVADTAAVHLGWVRDPAAAPRLIDALREGRQTARVQRALEVLSLESFRATRDRDEASRLYQGWLAVMGDRGPRAWLVDALAARGHAGEGLDAFAASGDVRAAVPAFLAAWTSSEWFLRRAIDLELRRASGRTQGEVDPWTSEAEVARMLDGWTAWWESARPAGR